MGRPTQDGGGQDFWEYDIWNDVVKVRRAMDQLLACPDVQPTLHRPTPSPWDC